MIDKEHKQLLQQYIKTCLEMAATEQELCEFLNELYKDHADEIREAKIFLGFTRKKLVKLIQDCFKGEDDIENIPESLGLRMAVSRVIQKTAERIEIQKYIDFNESISDEQRQWVKNRISDALDLDTLKEMIRVIFYKATHPQDVPFISTEPFGPGITEADMIHLVNQSYYAEDEKWMEDPKLYLYDLGIHIWALRELMQKHHLESAIKDFNKVDTGHRTRAAYRLAQGEHISYQGTNCAIVSGDTDFVQLNRTVVNSGSTWDREVIVIDPHSKDLLALYVTLKSSLENHPQLATLTQAQRLNTILQYVHDLLGRDFETVDLQHMQVTKQDPKTFVAIEELAKHHRGICRHHASLVAFFSGKLVKDGLLAPSDIHIFRDNTRDEAHQVVVIRDKMSDCCWILDSLNSLTCFAVPYEGNIADKENKEYDKFIRDFGKRYFQSFENRFKNK